MGTNVGDIVRAPEGPREVAWVMDADEWIALRTKEHPLYLLRGSSTERCAMFGTTKGTTPQEKHG